MKYLILFLTLVPAWAQRESYGNTANASSIYDLTAAAITRSIKVGASDPATCTAGKDLFINNSSTPVIKLCTATNTWTALGSSSMVYPGAGVAVSTSSAWGTSLTVGTGANNLVQLNGSSQLPAVSGALLTNIPAPAALATPRAIYGNNFDGSAALTGIIASTYGGTGNGFAKFSGPASTEKTFTLPNASATILTDNALVSAAQGGTGNGFFAVSGPASTTKTFTFPNASATVLTSNAAVTVAQGGTGATTLTGPLKGNGTSAFSAAAYTDLVALWASGSCSGFLKNDGTCASAGTGNMTVTTQAGAPSGACTAGSAWVLDTTAQEFYGCSVSGTWKKMLATADTGTSVWSMLEGAAPGAGASAGVHNTYFDSADHKLKSHANGGSVVTYMATDTNVAAAQMPALTGDVTTSAGAVATTIAANAVTPAKASAVMRTRAFTMVIPGTGASNVLQDADDQPAVWYNSLGQGIHITGVSCITDSATATTIQLQKNDGSVTNMLSSNLSCSSTRASTTTFVSTEDAMASTNGLDFLIVSAGGAGKWVSVTVTYTLD